MSARYKGPRNGRDRDKKTFTTGVRVFSLIAALVLLLGSIVVMYPGAFGIDVGQKLLDKAADEEKLKLDKQKIGFESFPLYGSERVKADEEGAKGLGGVLDVENAEAALGIGEDGSETVGFYGVKNIIEDSSEYIRDKDAPKPEFGKLIKRMFDQKGILQAIYDLLLITLISIPLSLLLRLLIYKAVYDLICDVPFLLRLPLRGLVTIACDVTCVCVSWLFYNTVLFDSVLNWAIEKLSSITTRSAAVNIANISAITIITALSILLVKTALFRALFRSTVGLSVFVGLFRCVIFLVLFASINVFAAMGLDAVNLRMALFALGFVLIAGLGELVLG